MHVVFELPRTSHFDSINGLSDLKIRNFITIEGGNALQQKTKALNSLFSADIIWWCIHVLKLYKCSVFTVIFFINCFSIKSYWCKRWKDELIHQREGVGVSIEAGLCRNTIESEKEKTKSNIWLVNIVKRKHGVNKIRNQWWSDEYAECQASSPNKCMYW